MVDALTQVVDTPVVWIGRAMLLERGLGVGGGDLRKESCTNLSLYLYLTGGSDEGANMLGGGGVVTIDKGGNLLQHN